MTLELVELGDHDMKRGMVAALSTLTNALKEIASLFKVMVACSR